MSGVAASIGPYEPRGMWRWLETIAAWLSFERAQTLLLSAGIGVVILLLAIAALVLLTVLVTLGRRVVRSWRARRSGR